MTVCAKIHDLFNRMPRFRFPFDASLIPRNGIYILFEQGEIGHGTDRIVRVGSHRGNGQLRSRLKEHFVKENKDRSIFRKNIGRALLNRDQDPFLQQWNLDLMTRAARQEHAHLIDWSRQQDVEDAVTDCLRRSFTFIVFAVPTRDNRLKLESKLISTVAQCAECRPSDRWLGSFSPIPKIRESGLWQIQELDKEPLTDADVDVMRIR